MRRVLEQPSFRQRATALQIEIAQTDAGQTIDDVLVELARSARGQRFNGDMSA